MYESAKMLSHYLRFSLAVCAAIALQGCKKADDVAIPPTPTELAEPTPPPTQLAAPKVVPTLEISSKMLRLVAWNLEWFPGHTPEPTPEAEQQHMAGVKSALTELKPDILLLEEVRDWKSAAEACSVVPGLNVHVVSAFPARPQNQVVASRLPANSAWSEPWKVGSVEPPRGFSFAALELPDGKFLLAYALHLKSNLGELPINIGLRQESIRQLLPHVRAMLALYGQRGPCAVIVGGDLNTSADDPQFAQERTLRALQAAGFYWTHEGVPSKERVTIPGKNGFADGCFDHVFTLGLGHPAATVAPHPGLSDHYPVIVELDLSKADFQPHLDVEAGTKILPEKFVMAPKENLAGVLQSNDDAGIRGAVGKIATVRGKVSRIGATANGGITFIDFAGNQRGQFGAVVRKDNLEAVAAPLGGDLNSALTGKTVEVQGEIALFKDSPQIIITKPDQLKVR